MTIEFKIENTVDYVEPVGGHKNKSPLRIAIEQLCAFDLVPGQKLPSIFVPEDYKSKGNTQAFAYNIARSVGRGWLRVMSVEGGHRVFKVAETKPEKK